MPNVVVEQPVAIFILHGIDWTPSAWSIPLSNCG